MRDVAAVSVTESSDGSYFLIIRKESGYSDEYVVQPREAKYLFNRLGRLLKHGSGVKAK